MPHVNELPQPHALDCDWRFSSQGVLDVARFAVNHRAIVAFGMPALARHLQLVPSCEVTLIDRQPALNVRSHLQMDVSDYEAIQQFDAAFLDPPWYPEIWKSWVAVAGRAVKTGGLVYATTWREETRPDAADQLRDLKVWACEHFEISEAAPAIAYDRPIFEELAFQAAGTTDAPQRFGALIQLRVKSTPPRIALPVSSRWYRFLLNNYQLALRRDTTAGFARLWPHPLGKGKYWPSVSRRTAGMDRIGLWSSHNEVAVVEGSEALLADLRTALRSSSPDRLQSLRAAHPALSDWSIPSPPYRRYLEWQSQQ